MEEVIKFKNVDKIYKLSKRKQNRNFLEIFFKSKQKNRKKVLDNISFSIGKGESVAFLGKNGSGKTTILKLITEVSYPSNGEVYVNGKVNALLELNAGFEPEFTGRENIYLKGTLLGLNKKDVKKIEEQIVSFADIGEYIDYPVKKYSSGMRARLGFSIAIHVEPEILVIDEALSVGDEEFKNRCLDKITQITKKKDITIIFVTHSLKMAKEFCKRGIVLEKGKIIFDGDIEDAIEKYQLSVK